MNEGAEQNEESELDQSGGAVVDVTLESLVSPSYGGLIGLAIAYGGILFFTILASGSGAPSKAVVTVPLGLGVVVGTLAASALWSTFGPGGYLKRTVGAYVATVPVILGAYIGSFLLISNYGPTVTELMWLTTMLVSYAFTATIGMQCVFWLFRYFGGWQFVQKGMPTQATVQLKDMFVMMLLVAISFSLAQTVAHAFCRVSGDQGWQSDEQMNALDQGIQIAIVSTLGGGAVVGLLVMVFVWLSYRGTAGVGLGYVIGFGLVIGFICAVIVAMMGGQADVAGFMIWLWIPIAGGIGLPLAVLRSQGYLWKRHRPGLPSETATPEGFIPA